MYTHRVADQGGVFKIVLTDETFNIFGQGSVIVTRIVGGFAMVSEVLWCIMSDKSTREG